jgi:hypothetical protein
MFVVAFFKIAKIWIRPRYESTSTRINKMCYIYIREYYSVRKKNEIMSLAGKWMALENIKLSKIKLRETNMYFLSCAESSP